MNKLIAKACKCTHTLKSITYRPTYGYTMNGLLRLIPVSIKSSNDGRVQQMSMYSVGTSIQLLIVIHVLSFGRDTSAHFVTSITF